MSGVIKPTLSRTQARRWGKNPGMFKEFMATSPSANRGLTMAQTLIICLFSHFGRISLCARSHVLSFHKPALALPETASG
jgi:hypothetical protein